MWSCNGSASPAVCPERRVFSIVTLWAAADERYVFGWERSRDARVTAGRVTGLDARGATPAALKFPRPRPGACGPR